MQTPLFHRFLAVIAMASLLTLSACGTTAEAQIARYKENKDRVEALVAKRPDLKAEIAAKSSEFAGEYDDAVAAEGDPKDRLWQLNQRMRKYIEVMDPSSVRSTTASSKLNRQMAPPPGTSRPTGGAPFNANSAVGGKLGGAPAPGAIPPPPNGPAPMGGKLGGGTAMGSTMGGAPSGTLGGPGGTAPTPATGGKLGGTP